MIEPNTNHLRFSERTESFKPLQEWMLEHEIMILKQIISELLSVLNQKGIISLEKHPESEEEALEQYKKIFSKDFAEYIEYYGNDGNTLKEGFIKVKESLLEKIPLPLFVLKSALNQGKIRVDDERDRLLQIVLDDTEKSISKIQKHEHETEELKQNL